MEEEQSGKEISFDTEEFRQILAFVKQKYRDGGDYLHSEFMNHSWDYAVLGNESPEEARRRKAQTVCLETVEGDAWDYAKYEGTTGVHVCGIPGIAGEATSQITADVLIINPNAPHKKKLCSMRRRWRKHTVPSRRIFLLQTESFIRKTVL